MNHSPNAERKYMAICIASCISQAPRPCSKSTSHHYLQRVLANAAFRDNSINNNSITKPKRVTRQYSTIAIVHACGSDCAYNFHFALPDLPAL